jgi:uncharacterized protein VirK/YbjX
MRTRIKSRKVTSTPTWIKEYLHAHTATADEIVQRYIDNDLNLKPKAHRMAELVRFINKSFRNDILKAAEMKNKYCKIEVFNPINVL